MFFILLLFIFLSFSFSIEVFSERLQRLPDGTLKAEGDVEAYYKNYYIRANLMTYDPEKRTVYAKGDVFIKSLDESLVVKGEEALLDVERDVGYFLEAEGSFKKFHFTAKRVEKKGENYTIEEGSITTCPPDKKEMKLCFLRADISKRYVVGQSNTLSLFNIPIAYLPIGVFPVGERRSGLLLPLLGSNTYNNLIYQQPIYWAISPNKDATLTIDYRDKQAKGISLEYRQSMRKELDLLGFLSIYKEPKPPRDWWQGRDPKTFRENRYRIKGNLDLDDLKAGVDLISDPYFMQDIHLTIRERTVPYLNSYLSYKRGGDSYLLTFELKSFYDTTSSNNKKTLQRLPEIGFYLREIKLLDFLYFNLTFSYVNFYRKEGLRSQRLLLFPEISIPKQLFGLTFLSSITWENFLYFDTKGEGYKPSSAFSSLRYVERVPYLFSINYGGLRINNFTEFSYSYRPKDYENPRFDSLDQLNKESLIVYKFNSSGSYKERTFYNLFMEGGYNYLGKFVYLGQEVKEKILPIRTLFQIHPMDALTFSFDNTYDINKGTHLRNIGSIILRYPFGSFTFGRTLEKNYTGIRISDQYNLSVSALYRSAKLSLGLVKDNKINKYIQRQLNFDYMGACWSLGFFLRDTYDGTRQKFIKEMFLTFNFFDLNRLTVPLKRQ